MSFDTPDGTHGAALPPAHEMKKFNQEMIDKIRAGEDVGEVLILTTIGHTSGKPTETPIAYFPNADGTAYVVASAAGSAKNPQWYRNLKADPHSAKVFVKGHEVEVSAEETHGEERHQVWDFIAANAPGFADYQAQTDRQIPVVKLFPRVPAD